MGRSCVYSVGFVLNVQADCEYRAMYIIFLDIIYVRICPKKNHPEKTNQKKTKTTSQTSDITPRVSSAIHNKL